jgi:hypothetical protein
VGFWQDEVGRSPRLAGWPVCRTSLPSAVLRSRSRPSPVPLYISRAIALYGHVVPLQCDLDWLELLTLV